MESIKLSVDRSKIDPNFDGYKVSMDNIHFESKKLEQNIFLRTPSNSMVTLQHMKVFSNDNQLFCNAIEGSESHEHLYRILETGHIQKMVYDKKTRQWDISIVGNIPLKGNETSAFPTNLLFTNKNIVVASNGLSEISVFLAVSGSNWVNMLTHKVTENSGISLIEARIIDEKLNILVYEVENDDKNKKTRSRVHWIVVKLDDIDYAENLSIEKTTEFIQKGHFETCTFSNEGDIVFLSSEKPHVEGHEDASEVTVLDQSWSQAENIITVRFKLAIEIAQEDVKIDLTKTAIKLILKETTILNGKLGGEIDENDVEICADQKENTLILKLKALDDKKWEKLIAIENWKLESLENEEMKKMDKEEQVYGTDEPMEECDEADSTLFFYWVHRESGKVISQCDVSGSQVLFVRRDCMKPANFCLRHDVDGILWSFDSEAPSHVATLQAFGYVQASKTTRLWSGCSPNISLACIVEGNNRVLLYSQKVEISGSLSNRKTAQKVSHVSKQYLLRVDCSDPIRGVHLTETHIFAATKEHIHVAELTL
ncbi:hypothetical protein GCK72_001247 [Caenorhabditis remanei]|uniref:NudC domain-containing protein 1 n=1 Tax=Caenorhabditis remanei TaxID=31234 RepID=A0A6A5HMH5_CAERE|nr:hypothetical protein GCK72_001247 [Caenorhabditis remanei]KAF1769430.1 hypothetical protein GCK72_001247 [Caenorhabditis remanei]